MRRFLKPAGLLLALLSTSASAQEPTLSVAGATAQGVKLRTQTARLEQVLEIRSISAVPVDPLRVTVGPLLDSTGVAHSVRWTLDAAPGNEPVAVAAFATLALRVEADLPSDDVYTGEIALSYAGRRETTPLQVVRAKAELPLEIGELSTLRGSAGFWGPSSVPVLLTLSETSGNPLTLEPPVATLSLLLEEEATYQVDVKVASSQEFPFRLEQSRQIELSLTGLPGAGRYEGNLRFEAPGYEPVEQPIRVVVRESRWVALSFILLGVVLSFGIKKYTSQRNRLVMQGRAKRLDEKLDELATPEDGTADGLRKRLSRRLSDALKLPVKDGRKVLDLAELQIGLFAAWQDVRNRVEALRPATLRAEFQADLSEAEGLLRRQDATVEEIRPCLDRLQEVPGRIADRLRGEELRGQIERLAGESDGLRESFPDEAETIATALREADGLIRDGRLDQGLERVNDARRVHLGLLFEDFRKRLKLGKTPWRMNEGSWRTLCESLQGRLQSAQQALDKDLEEAAAAYQAAKKEYLTEVLEPLREEEGVDEIRRKIDEASLKEAEELYEDKVRSLENRKGTLSGRRGFESLSVPSGPDLSTWIGDVLPGIALPAASPAPVPAFVTYRAADVERRLFWGDLFVMGTIFALAGLLGVQVLWETDPAWGGWNARLIAFLWGLGLHQVTFDRVAPKAEEPAEKKDS